MRVQKIPEDISKLIGYYDKTLAKRYKAGLAGETEVECFNRFAKELKKQKKNNFQYYFDTTEVERVVEFASLLQTYDAQGNIVSVELYPIQLFIIANIYGWKDKETGYLRFRETYIQLARRNGKSWLSSVLLHYFLICSTYRSERAILFSVKRDLADIAFKQFCQFIEADPELDRLYQYAMTGGYAKSLITDNYCRVFTGAKTADGFKSGYAVSDECALADGSLDQLILDGQSDTPQSMLIRITTAGFYIDGWCHKMYKGLKKELVSESLPETTFICITEPDETDSIDDWRTWAKANPILFFDREGNIRKDKVALYKTKYKQAQADANKLNSFITKQANRWNAQADRMVCNLTDWSRCKYPFTFQQVLDNYKIWYLGIDLAQVADLNSIAFCTFIKVKDRQLMPCDYMGDYESKLYINVINFIPQATLTRHIQGDKVPYNHYVGKELFLTVGGKGLRTDYKEIYQYIENIGSSNALEYRTIACDPYGIATIQSDLEAICTNLIMQAQHPTALSSWIERFSLMVASGEIAVSENSCDILTKAIENAIVVTNPQGYLRIEKPTATKMTNYRIDPLDATIDGIIAPIIDHERDVSTTDALDEFLYIYNS